MCADSGLLAFNSLYGCQDLFVRRSHVRVDVGVLPTDAAGLVNENDRGMRDHISCRIAGILEQLRIELTVPVYDVMARIGKQREIRWAALLLLLPFHHFLGAFDVVRAKGKNLSGLFQMLI